MFISTVVRGCRYEFVEPVHSGVYYGANCLLVSETPG